MIRRLPSGLLAAASLALGACASTPPPPPPAPQAPAPAPEPSARDHYLAGRAALAAGDAVAARARFRAAAERLPTWALPRLELAELAVLRREEVAGSRAELAALATRGEASPRLLRLQGELAELDGDDAAAAEAFGRYLALLDVPALRARRAAALDRLGRPAEAADEYRRVVLHDPEDLTARALLADNLERAGRLAEARAELEELVRRQPGRESPLRRLARFHERQGDVGAAKAAHLAADRAREKPLPGRKLRPLPPSKR